MSANLQELVEKDQNHAATYEQASDDARSPQMKDHHPDTDAQNKTPRGLHAMSLHDSGRSSVPKVFPYGHHTRHAHPGQ